MERRMSGLAGAAVCLAGTVLVGCQSGTTGGAQLPPGGTALLEVSGRSPEVTILNSGPAELQVSIGSGAMTPNIVTIPAGVTRWWYPAAGELFRFENRSAKSLDLSYRVRNASIRLYQPAPK